MNSSNFRTSNNPRRMKNEIRSSSCRRRRLAPRRLCLDDTLPPTRSDPPGADIALFRIISNRIPSLSAADPVEGAKVIPVFLKMFEVLAELRLRSPSPKPRIVRPNLSKEAAV